MDTYTEETGHFADLYTDSLIDCSNVAHLPPCFLWMGVTFCSSFLYCDFLSAC